MEIMKLTDDFNRSIRWYRVWLTSPPFGRYGKRKKRREARRKAKRYVMNEKYDAESMDSLRERGES